MAFSSEFNRVHELLFTGCDDNPEQRDENWRKGAEELDIWILRRSVLCPAAIHATKVILDALLKDNEQYSSVERQIFYCNGLLRFMNYMSSVMHTPITHSTMYDKAKELGLPSFLVDLRHTCAHGQVMPSLQILSNATNCCFKWLHKFYWSKQKEYISNVNFEHITSIENVVKCENELMSLTYTLDTAIYIYMYNENIQIEDIKRLIPKWRYDIFQRYCKDRKNLDNCKEFIQTLLNDLQNTIENDVTLRNSPTTCMDFLIKMYYLFNMIDDNTTENEHFYTKLLDVMQPFFRLMAIHNILMKFFNYLFEILENRHSSKRNIMAAMFWALRLAEGFRVAHQCRIMHKYELEKVLAVMPFHFYDSIPFYYEILVSRLIYLAGQLHHRGDP